MTTIQLLVLCVTALAAVGVVAFAHDRVRAAELQVEGLRMMHEAQEAEAAREDARRRDLAKPRPPAGSVLAVHVAGAQTVRGTLEPDDTPGWYLLSDAELMGAQPQALGGRQWISEAHVSHVQEF